MIRYGMLIAGCVVLAGICASGQAQSESKTSQGMMPKDADPGWEAATVKPSDPDYKYDFISTRGRHVVIKNQTVEKMLMTAYGLQRSQIIGTPDWARTERFDVDGVPDVIGEPNMKQFRLLIRKLLEERFGLNAHEERREMPIYALTVAKGGPKMEPSKGDPNGLPDNEGMGGNGRQIRKFTNVSMPELAQMLQFNVDRPMEDRTGVTGRYDFKLQWTVDDAPTTDADAPPGLFTAIQEQIGLKLEAVKAPVEVMVIDKLERPGAN